MILRNHGSPIAEEAVRQIALLYGVDSTVRGMAPGVRLAARREFSAPVVTALKTWFEAQLSRVPKGSQIAHRYPLCSRSLVRPDPVPRGRAARVGHQPLTIIHAAIASNGDERPVTHTY
jgi:hypothetical protein